jgi:DNA-binding SARP family transcriptional activator
LVVVPIVSFRVLGPLEAGDGHGPVDLRGPRHRAVLARLLIARGRVVPVTRLIDDLWAEAPEGARGTVQTFVGALRKALEPERPPRTPSTLLVTVPPGYALRPEAGAVDAWSFEAAVAEAAGLPAAAARSRLDEALALWRGPAYAEFLELEWARAEAGRLDELRLLAELRRAEAALALGRAAESVPDLEAQVAAYPLREEAWRLLAAALYQSGRQGDALATLRRARELLVSELGVDPGQALKQLEADILAQAPHLTPPAGNRALPGGVIAASPGEQPFVGRTREMTELQQTATAAVSAGGPRLALISGAAGAGKTALARALTTRLTGEGWTVAWGAGPAPEPTGGDPVAARFRRQQAIRERLAARAPAVLILDDLHWADEETLSLLTALPADPAAGPVLVVGTFRSTDLTTGLTEALGRAARLEPARVYLGGLTAPQVHDLVTTLTGRPVAEAEARTIHRRSAGNPFFVRELARLWAAEGEQALHAVPPGVRDVIRHRLAALSEPARDHLRQAAILGHEVDLNLLIPLTGATADEVLASTEEALAAGFLVEQDADRLSFAHALVQETLYADLSAARRARWHTATAELIAKLQPGDVERTATHFVRAQSRTTAAQAAHYARLSAERAEQRCAPHEARERWQQTIDALDRASGSPGGVRARVEAVMGLVRALAVTGDLRQARRLRAEALRTAETLGDPLLTARVIGSYDVPAIWTANDDEDLSHRVVTAAEQTLEALPAANRAERARLLGTIAMERRADTGPRGNEAAREAEAIAREVGDPVLLAFALNGRFLQTFHRAGLAPERGALGDELLALATRHEGLVTYEVLGHLIGIQTGAALADLAEADHHARAADALAERYDLPLVAVFTGFYAALRLAMTGHCDEARTKYRLVAARLPTTGMSGLEDGILPLALLTLQDPVPPADLSLAVPGSAAPGLRDSPPDLLLEARTCLQAMAALRAGDRAAMSRLYAKLLPAARELAGAGSGLLTFGPTALYLGHLATALGRPAAVHFRQALEIAERAGAPQWAAEAHRALR